MSKPHVFHETDCNIPCVEIGNGENTYSANNPNPKFFPFSVSDKNCEHYFISEINVALAGHCEEHVCVFGARNKLDVIVHSPDDMAEKFKRVSMATFYLKHDIESFSVSMKDGLLRINVEMLPSCDDLIFWGNTDHVQLDYAKIS